ncbi:hypothetical protein WA026_022785 [Henosepilachna vigintioctopunctata]|uniref:Myb-like domain-containing protein n=1 Tax=Henosepilachna vigintioctopunctata TaxID=420089 RepID=A0AAW1VJK3_9CUCU
MLLATKHISVIDEELLENLKSQDILIEATSILWKSVLQDEKKLSNKLSVQDPMDGEDLVPEDLSLFYFSLIAEEDLLISFRINGFVHNIEVSQEEVELYNSLVDDNEFALDYLNTLIESEEISLNEELEEIYRINPNSRDSEDKIFPIQYTNIVENKVWCNPETRLLLEKYEIYIKEVGQSKLYRNKKCMWEQIANDINKKFKMKKTAVQVENRFKTLLRRKEYDAKYRKTGKEEDNNFKEKLRILSLERPPKRKYRKFDSICDSPPDERERSLQKTLERIHSEKEAAKKRRHEETLSILKKHEAAKERRHREILQMYKELLQNKDMNGIEFLLESE